PLYDCGCHPRSTPFPYTTLFRSDLRPPVHQCQHDDPERRLHLRMLVELVHHDLRDLAARQLEHHADPLAARLVADLGEPLDPLRSEEHTSELQSRVDLVCRLLLE